LGEDGEDGKRSYSQSARADTPLPKFASEPDNHHRKYDGHDGAGMESVYDSVGRRAGSGCTRAAAGTSSTVLVRQNQDRWRNDLRSEQLRDAAVAVLARAPGVGQPIHYRQWFALLLEEGHKVSGKDPLATFLTQVTRSPLVMRAPDDAGVYKLDPKAAADRAMQARTEAEATLVEAQAAYLARASADSENGGEAGAHVLADVEAQLRAVRRRVEATERAVAEVARAETMLYASISGDD
jgi:hypothetical protein